MLDLVEYAVKLAGDLGASYSEARYHGINGFTIYTRNGNVIGSGITSRRGIAVRVVVNGALGFAATPELTRDGVRKTVEKAVSLAKAVSQLMKKPLKQDDSRLGRARYSVVAGKPFDSIPLDEKVNYMMELWKTIQGSTKEARIPVLTVTYNEWTEEKTIVNSDGGYVESSIPRITMYYNVVVTSPVKGSLQRWEQLGGSGGLELLEKWRLHEKLPEEISRYEEILFKAVPPPTDPVDVIVGSEIVGLVVHESCGHPSEADRIMGREAAQAGKSFIKPGMQGSRIGNEYATVIDDPTIPGSYGFYLYDDEAVPARARYLYKEGVIYEHLQNRFTAPFYNTRSNGAARAMDYASEPIIRMANTYLKPGDMSFEELLESVKRGVYIKSYMEWNIDDERWSQRYVGLEAYMIENGELKEYVRNPVLEVTTKSFYSSIDGVDRNLEFYAGTCGKGEPSQGVPVWFGGPNVKLKNIRLRSTVG
ncbi:MAG: TldD/PmbA family protein [Desulfurococcus sp.]|uniref:TldD/PmbA family protein n=1 Tax=Desulfurococcus sp. TaxID=51678 RepID=UPI00315F89C2